jgi:hypothetical protein
MADTKPIQIKSIFDNSEFPTPDQIDLEQYYEVEIEFENDVQVAWTFYFMKNDGTTVAYRVGKEKCESTGSTNGSSTEKDAKDAQTSDKDKQIAEKDTKITELTAEVERLKQQLNNKQITGTATSGLIGNVMNTVIPKITLQPTINSLNVQSVKYEQLNSELKTLIEKLRTEKITTENSEQTTKQLSEKLTQISQQNAELVETNSNTVKELETASKKITELEAATKANEIDYKRKLAEQAKAAEKALAEAKEKALAEALAAEKEKALAEAKQQCDAQLAAADLKAKQDAADLKAKQDAADLKAKQDAAALEAKLTDAEKAKAAAEQAKQECDKKLADAEAKAKDVETTKKQDIQALELEKQQLHTSLEQASSEDLQQKPAVVSSQQEPAKSLTAIFTKDYISKLNANNLDEQLKNPIDEWITYYKSTGVKGADDTDIDVLKKPFKEIIDKLKQLNAISVNPKISEVLAWIQTFSSNKSNKSHLTSKEYSKKRQTQIELKTLKNDFSQLKTSTLKTINDESKAFFDLLTNKKSTLESELKQKNIDLENFKKSKKVDTSRSVQTKQTKESEIKSIKENLEFVTKQIQNYEQYKTKTIDPYIKEITDIKPDLIAKSKDYASEFEKNTKTINEGKTPILAELTKFEGEFYAKFPKHKKKGGSSRKAKPRKSKSITFRAYS